MLSNIPAAAAAFSKHTPALIRLPHVHLWTPELCGGKTPKTAELKQNQLLSPSFLSCSCASFVGLELDLKKKLLNICWGISVIIFKTIFKTRSWG